MRVPTSIIVKDHTIGNLCAAQGYSQPKTPTHVPNPKMESRIETKGQTLGAETTNAKVLPIITVPEGESDITVVAVALRRRGS